MRQYGAAGCVAYSALRLPRYSRFFITVASGSISDPHQQHLLRGHDMEISALAMPPSGALIATGDTRRIKKVSGDGLYSDGPHSRDTTVAAYRGNYDVFM